MHAVMLGGEYLQYQDITAFSSPQAVRTNTPNCEFLYSGTLMDHHKEFKQRIQLFNESA